MGDTRLPTEVALGVNSYVTDSGKFRLGVDLGSISLGDMSCPLRLSFSSDPDEPSSLAGLPTGWSLVALETGLVQINESYVVAKLPNGLTKSFRTDEDGGFIAKDGSRLHLEGTEAKLVTEKYSAKFSEGRLTEISFPKSQRKWAWKYNDDSKSSLKGIYNADGSSVLTVKKESQGPGTVLSVLDHASHLLAKIDYLTIKHLATLDGGSRPRFGDFVTAITTPKFSLSVDHINDGENPDRETMELGLRGQNFSSETRFAWNSQSGELSEIPGYTMVIQRTLPVSNAQRSSHIPSIDMLGINDGSRTHLQNEKVIDDSTGVVREHTSSGENKLTKFFTFNDTSVIRSITIESPAGRVKTYDARFDTNGIPTMVKAGSLERRIENGKIRHYENGVLIGEF